VLPNNPALRVFEDNHHVRMLGIQHYASSSGSGSESSESDDGETEKSTEAGGAGTTSELPEHLKPLKSDSSTSVMSKMMVLAAPEVVVNVSERFIKYTQCLTRVKNL